MVQRFAGANDSNAVVELQQESSSHVSIGMRAVFQVKIGLPHESFAGPVGRNSSCAK
jgi:hypothetical protein